MPSLLCCCWLGVRKSIWPVKNRVMRCWHDYLSGARCIMRVVQLMPLPLHHLFFIKIQNGFIFLVLAYPGCPGKEATKWVFVCLF